MREMGLEPTRPIGHKILSLACLPISALPQTSKKYTGKIIICQLKKWNCANFKRNGGNFY
jgi:hypothetical protein